MHCVFHSIRFKVNKGWSTAVLLFFCPFFKYTYFCTMKKYLFNRNIEEICNTLTHLLGVVLTLSLAWVIIRLGYRAGWEHAFGVTFFTSGMLLMFASSTLYHWWLPGKGKHYLRIFDHIGIYVMIAASYTPICVGVVGGALGWIVFGLLWLVAIGGAFYKITAINKYPRLSLLIYLAMGWSVVFIAEPVFHKLSVSALWCILAEGIFYTSGTYFFTHDYKPFYHAVWHVFVLLGAMCHWTAIVVILSV